MRRSRRLTAALVLSLVGAGIGIGAGVVPKASAVTPPVGFTADNLPTWQTNGIVWAMAQANGVVFAGGTFSVVRPPAGTSGPERKAVNFAALDAATGKPTSCDLSFTIREGTATVRALAVSKDKKTLYAGGRFGAVNGVGVSNVAAIDIATCRPKTSFRPVVNATVRALAVANGSVYLGGDFTSVAGQARRYFASVTTSGALRPWKADADETGRAIEVTPDGNNVLLGGDFFRINGADSHALAVVDSNGGTPTRNYPLGFFAALVVVKDITTDATGFYTASEAVGSQDEGRSAISLSDFRQRWRDPCKGATQAVEVHKGVVYSGSHAHDCSGIDGFPEQANGLRQHLLAQSVNAPALLGWTPDTNNGLGEGVGPRAMTTASKNGTDYLWVGGEFTKVTGTSTSLYADKPQQGLTRFASGPDTGAPSVPQEVSASSTRSGEIDVRWKSSFDHDDSKLTYRVYRNGSSTPVHTVTGSSMYWKRPQLTFTDTDVTPGSTYTYRITASDGSRNTSALSAPVTVSGTATAHIALYRCYNPGNGDHLDTTSPNCEGYPNKDGRLGHIPAQQAPDAVALYRCYNPRNGDHLTTTNPNCEGYPNKDGRLGFIYTTQVSGSIPLYRCYNPGNGDHLTTTSPNCEGYPNKDGRLGYVIR
ncbi:fibronectin type III domain-containing protein [Streptomyces sp. MUM 178J]|uniref:fibronectin type III domain-containing protein n=1 Tax=Streptomyces sp. MUM 178J TaxID=2791991 RepID=UPI001F040289|nr:hypothetical protein [Streptomyces sp. MUM 178J]WRQ80373.1 hypothetical protein I3F59_014030 [Streptomyces sp. MUM 178J]